MLSCCLLLSGANAAPKVFQFSANWAAPEAELDHPALNGKANLGMIVTQVWTDTANNHQVGLYYNQGSKKWNVMNEDNAAMPIGCKFNVYIPSCKTTVYSTPQNSGPNHVCFTMQKNKPNAILLFTHRINPFPKMWGLNVRHNAGLFYSNATVPPMPFRPGWSICYEDYAPTPAACFTVADATKDPNAFVLATNAGNVSGNSVVIDHPVANNNPNAIIFVNHNMNPAGYPVNWHDKVLGVWYNGSQWMIFNQDGSDMPVGKTFNVNIFPSVTP